METCRRLLAGSVFLTLPFIFGTFSGQSSMSAAVDRQALQNLEEKWLQSEDNPDALQNILGDDFVHALSFGFISKEEQLQYLRRKKPRPNLDQKSFEDLRVRIYENCGIVNGIVMLTAPDGHKERTIFSDVFVRRNGRWEAVNAQELAFQPGTHP